MAESEEELKKPLDESERGWLKVQLKVPSLHGKQMGNQWKQLLTLFFWGPKLLQMVIAAMKLKDAYSLEGKL